MPLNEYGLWMAAGVSGLVAYWIPGLAYWIGSGKCGEPVHCSFRLKPLSRVFFAIFAAGLSWTVQWKLGTGWESWMATVLVWLLLVIALTDICFFLHNFPPATSRSEAGEEPGNGRLVPVAAFLFPPHPAAD